MKRTLQQNKSIHLYCEQLAQALNDAGYDMTNVEIKIPTAFTKENVKELLFKPVMHSLYPDKTSTTQLEKIEVSDVYEVMNRATAMKFGVSLPFPSEDHE